jgi:hypothetical protein
MTTRLHVGVAMPEKGGRPAVVAAEVRRAPDRAGRRQWHYVVGHVDRVPLQTIQGARDAVTGMVARVADLEPCVFVDAGTAQGIALRKSMRPGWPEKLHRPHGYERTRFDVTMFAHFLEAYADARITFLPDLPFRRDLDRALVLFRSEGVSKAGAEQLSEDDALVFAASLAVMFPTHGPTAALYLPPEPDDETPPLETLRHSLF